MNRDQKFNLLLATLYETPLSPGLWPSFLRGLSEMLGLHACSIIHTDLASTGHGLYSSSGIDPEIERLYATEYGVQDVYRPRFLRLQSRQGHAVMGDELCSVAEMRKTAFYEDILRRADIRLWCAVATVQTASCVENISLYHPWNSPAPGDAELAIVRQVAPHIHSTFRVRARLSHLEGLNRDLYSALDRAGSAIVLLDKRGRSFFVNAHAKRILDQGDGLLYINGRLSTTDSREAAKLAALICAACASRYTAEPVGGGSLRVSRKGGKFLHLRVASLTASRLAENSKYAAIVLIEDPHRERSLATQLLTLSYGLSPAEVRLCALITEGRSVSEAAAIKDVSAETIRSQIKSIFQKTGVRRQSELMRFLLEMPSEA